MKLVGLTGGVGMGKSTSASLLRERGFPLVDTDDLARDEVGPGKPALAEIAAVFGVQVLAQDGSLRRDELARIVFRDEASRKKLEGILHPRIREAWLSHVQDWQREKHPIGFIIIPLLFETGAEQYFDKTICTACSPQTQLARLSLRGWSAEQSLQRIHSQWPTDKKMRLSDFVVWTEGELAVHGRQWDMILTAIR
ncbi:MAG TPA: dephospho-CoA kinase [Candidatus Saccharimonadales bacterium]|nr:dephospho-CoA kinase [Candidatus Saccharimonadales bacterium]